MKMALKVKEAPSPFQNLTKGFESQQAVLSIHSQHNKNDLHVTPPSIQPQTLTLRGQG